MFFSLNAMLYITPCFQITNTVLITTTNGGICFTIDKQKPSLTYLNVYRSDIEFAQAGPSVVYYQAHEMVSAKAGADNSGNKDTVKLLN